MKSTLIFVCESGTDVRLIDGLARHFRLTVLLRTAYDGRSINWHYEGPEQVEVIEGPASRTAFARFALGKLLRARNSGAVVLAQNEGLSALAANATALVSGLPVWLLVCSPSLAYFQCRHRSGQLSSGRYLAGMAALRALRRGNALLRARYVVLSNHLVTAVGNGARAEIVPVYGVDTSRYVPVSAERKSELRRSLQLPPGPLILNSSRVAPEKDLATLMGAVRLLADRRAEFRVLNLGGGHRAFLASAQRHGVAQQAIARDAVHPVNELPMYYQAADVCVQASLEEGLGFSPLEALACEVPVVATAVGGLRETVIDGETGLSVPPSDAPRLADALEYALTHADEMRLMAQRGRQMVLDRYEAANCFARLAHVINGEVRARTGPGSDAQPLAR